MFYNKTRYFFGFSFLALSIDHEISKFYENDKKILLNLKKNVLKQEQQKKLLLLQKKLVLKQI